VAWNVVDGSAIDSGDSVRKCAPKRARQRVNVAADGDGFAFFEKRAKTARTTSGRNDIPISGVDDFRTASVMV